MSKGFQLFLESRAGVWLTSRLGPFIQKFLPSAKYLGSGTLFGALFGGGMSYLSGNDPETVIKDATIGAVVGLLSGGIGSIAAKGFQSFLGSRLGAGLASKLSPFLQRFLPHAVGGSAEGIADIQQLVEGVGLDELTVISPSGTQIIRPDPNFKRKSW